MFSDKTILVTGAGQGIGLCIADHFLKNGGKVIIAEKNKQLHQQALYRLGNPNQCCFICADVASEQAVKETIGFTLERFGRLHAVVHNAAISKDTPVETLDYSDWRQVLDVNLSGAMLCAKYAASELRKTGGAMVLIASTRALMSEPNTESYAASKAGLVGLTHALAVSLSPVRVNCISPGWIVTDNWMHTDKKIPLTERDHAQHPAGRVGRPEDIAEMAAFLCSDKAGFITGQNIIIDGGMTKKMIYC